MNTNASVAELGSSPQTSLTQAGLLYSTHVHMPYVCHHSALMAWKDNVHSMTITIILEVIKIDIYVKYLHP